MNEHLSSQELIKAVLASFKIQTCDLEELSGTNVTLYKFRPQIGVRISKIRGIKDELAAALRVPSVRIIAPMYDGCVGIEIPNKQREIVPLSDILESQEYLTSDMALPLAIGRTVTNEIFMADLAEMPHLLVAGATGQGKSVGLNVMLMSLMHHLTPDELKLVLIDPKQVEFSIYENYPSAYFANLGLNESICTDPDSAEQTLNSVCKVMEQRYSLLRQHNVRNIQEYNRSVGCCGAATKLPYIVVVIDEYGDLIMQSGKEIERYICRLAQKTRAVGIHLIISTQRPSSTIITGNIKANFPARIAFRTTTGFESRIIIDCAGAEILAGRGDMLFCMGADITRVQCAYVDTDYIYNFRDELSTKYEDHDNPSLFLEEHQKQEQPEQQPIFLSQCLFKSIEGLAHCVADGGSTTNTEIVRKYLGGSYHAECAEMMIQLHQLGIISKPDFWYGGTANVLIRNHEQISDIIRRAKEFEPDK
ncbi:MAG: DNA translocase FtsK [Prevotella sp.]|nr:DNA translocase FtsK [Prevotella sp.]